MPSTSRKQANFMAMCSSTEGRAKARGKCPPQGVAREFRHADSQRKAMRKIASR